MGSEFRMEKSRRRQLKSFVICLERHAAADDDDDVECAIVAVVRVRSQSVSQSPNERRTAPLRSRSVTDFSHSLAD